MREKGRGGKKRRGARRKRILTGTAVIWRALCFEYLVGKRWTRDDVRFSRGRTVHLRIMLCGGIKRGTGLLPSPREICLRLLVPSKCHNRLCVSEGRLLSVRSFIVVARSQSHSRRSRVINHANAACVLPRSPDDRILE